MANYIHKKSGKVYELVLGNVINATNAQDGEQMILYRSLEGRWFVRTQREFKLKFTLKNKRNENTNNT